MRISLAQKVFLNLHSTKNTGKMCGGAEDETAPFFVELCGALQSAFGAGNREMCRWGLGGNKQNCGK